MRAWPDDGQMDVEFPIWQSGLRSGQDYDAEDQHMVLQHRPETDTSLKINQQGEPSANL